MPSTEWFPGSCLVGEWIDGCEHRFAGFLVFIFLNFWTQRQSLESQGTGVGRSRKGVDPGNNEALHGTERAGKMTIHIVRGNNALFMVGGEWNICMQHSFFLKLYVSRLE